MNIIRLFTDGSHITGNDTAGYAYLLYDSALKTTIALQGGYVLHHGTRQVAGELAAVLNGLHHIITLAQYNAVLIIHDYFGVRNWVTGDWKTKKLVTQQYKEQFFDLITKHKIRFRFKHHKSHNSTNINIYHEQVDRLSYKFAHTTITGTV